MKQGEVTQVYAPDLAFEFLIYLDLDTIDEYRTIYGVFDFLGDVGGLLDLFTLFAERLLALIGWLVGSDLNIYLASHLFKTESKTKRINRSINNDPALHLIESR